MKPSPRPRERTWKRFKIASVCRQFGKVYVETVKGKVTVSTPRHKCAEAFFI